MYQEEVQNRRSINVELKAGNYAYYNIAEQWNAMLADPETADWSESLILSLLTKVDSATDKDDTLSLFDTPEWKSIIDRRGPAEAAWQSKCTECGLINIGFGTSGFLDEYYSIDYESKIITWRSTHADGAELPDYTICDKCGNNLHDKVWLSPFVVIKGYTIVSS